MSLHFPAFFLLTPCLQFNICANSSLQNYAKIFPRNNDTVSVDIYQGVSATPALSLATPCRGWGLYWAGPLSDHATS